MIDTHAVLAEFQPFLGQGKIPVVGEITEELQAKLCYALQYAVALERPPETITLLIDSTGGDFRAGIIIFDTIRRLNTQVCGIVTGKASSAAFAILQACDLRLAYPNARLMIHSPMISFQIDSDDLEVTLNDTRDEYNKLLQYIARRSKIPIADLRHLADTESVISGTYACEVGLVDGIVRPKRKKRPL